jgi:hypothetical protein
LFKISIDEEKHEKSNFVYFKIFSFRQKIDLNKILDFVIWSTSLALENVSLFLFLDQLQNIMLSDNFESEIDFEIEIFRLFDIDVYVGVSTKYNVHMQQNFVMIVHQWQNLMKGCTNIGIFVA